MKHLNELLRTAKQLGHRRQSVAVANPLDFDLMKAIKMAIELDLASFHLFGDIEKMGRMANEVNLDLVHLNITVHEAVVHPAKAAVAFVKNGQADILMKGNVSTKELLQAVLHKQTGLRKERLLSHVALFDIPGRQKPVFLTDAAINIAPDFKEKVQIAKNAVDVAKALGIACPKVAVIAPVDVINEAIPSTIDAARLAMMQEVGEITGCLIGGPISFDNAISVESAKHKGQGSRVAGTADILMVPAIEVGNALYKSFVFFARAEAAAIVCGASAPIVLPSRADSAESKLYSLALAIVVSGRI